jgi:LTXXQ motif family protein
MRPHRLVLVSAALASAMMASGADARPRFPGILGAVLGTVGGIVGLSHHGAGGPRYGTRHVATHSPVRAADARPDTEKAATEKPGGQATTGAASAGTAPVFWPSLYDDTFDYVLWPTGTDDRFWAHGYGDVVEAAFRPASRPADRMARRGRPQQLAGQTTGVASGAGGSCGGEKSTQPVDAMIERIEQTIQPTDAQRPLLEELHTAALHALDYVEAACPADRPLTPTVRLDSMEDRLWAARQALMITRAPLDKLYGALTDEQKARLNGPMSQTAQRGCGQANVDLPLAQMGQRGRLSEDRRAGLDMLRKTSAGLARLVEASCPSGTAATPMARLDVADRRLNAMLYAVVTLRAPLDAFASTGDRPTTQAKARR